MQLEGYNNIFVAGDVASLSMEKTAQNAEKQGKLVVKNIFALEKDSELTKYNVRQTPLVFLNEHHVGEGR